MKARVNPKTAKEIRHMKRIGKRSCVYIAKKLKLASSTVKSIR